jgi:peptidoglycan-associated lipoprotein
MRTSRVALTIVSMAVLLSACSTPPKVEEKPAPVPPKTEVKETPKVAPVAAAPMIDPLNDPNNILSKRSIYFDFDRYEVKPEFANVVEAHAKYVADSKSRKVMIQGNTDERGGAEYNLALGQKRAEAVRKAMVLMGTPDAQLEAVSYGKEKPKAMGHDEAAWAENRRTDIVYVAK